MTPYEEGKAAQESDHAEPICPYVAGTKEYKEFAEGFCERIIRILKNDRSNSSF
jgi:hypothetical protein